MLTLALLITAGLPVLAISTAPRRIHAARTRVMQVSAGESSSVILGQSKPTTAEEAIDAAQAAEIVGEEQTQRRQGKFIQLVVFPLGVILAVVILVRRGLFS